MSDNANTQKLFKSQINNLTENPEKIKSFQKLTLKENWPVFEVKDKKAYFTDVGSERFHEKNIDDFVVKVKLWLKKCPFIFSVIYKIIGTSFLGISPQKAIKDLPLGSVILNLGSGVTSVREDIVNIDFYPFENVNVIADIANLPFADNSVDGIICESVFEHIPDPEAVTSEIYRVLKPGGIVYVVVPFVFSFHSSPNDYYRWSKMGLREQFKNFEEVSSGMRSGPGAAMDWILAEYVAILLSFSSRKIHQILFMFFLVLFAPLCYLDYLIYWFPTSENIASHVYFVGKKK